MAKAAEAVKAAIADEAEPGARKLRTDFPILQQRFHAKPLTYLDSTVHRGVYLLAERATERFEGSREEVRAFISAASARDDRRRVAIRAGDHGCQPLMTRLGVAATNGAGFDLYTVPEGVDRLVQGLHKLNPTPGMGRTRDDPSDGGTRG